MKQADFTQPELLLKTFAEDGTRNTLPLVNTDTSNKQRADLTNGFPIWTEGDPEDGKLPPERADVNALGYLTTSYDFFYQAGGMFTFSSTIATAIGGYPKSARLWYTNSDGVSMLLESTKDDNEDDFNDDDSYIGTSWKIVSLMGIENSSIKLLDFMFRDKEINDMAWVLSDGSWLSGATYVGAYNHLIDDIGYRAVENANAPAIYVSATNAGFSGYAVRRSALDKTVDGTTYYAWNASSSYSYDKTIYLTLNVDSMTMADAINAMQGQRIYTTTDGTAFSLSINKVVSYATDTYTINGSDVDLNVMVGSDGARIVYCTNGGTEYQTVADIYDEIGIAWYYTLDTYNTRFKVPRTKYGINGYRGTVGGYIEAGLPDHIHHYAQAASDSGFGYAGVGYWGNDNLVTKNVRFHDPDSIYGNSDTVQPPATECYLYFYVGGFNETALVQTAGITASTINAKMDVDASNATATGKSSIVGWGMPDYSAGVTISTTVNTVYSPTKDGIFILTVSQDNASVSCHVQILDSSDNILISDIGNECHYQASWGSVASIVLPLPKGNKIKITKVDGSNKFCAFYPMKGVV